MAIARLAKRSPKITDTLVGIIMAHERCMMQPNGIQWAIAAIRLQAAFSMLSSGILPLTDERKEAEPQ